MFVGDIKPKRLFMKKDKIIYWISGVVLAVAFTVVIISMFRSNKEFKLSDPALFKDYIAAYTGGVISKTDVIAIQLTDKFAKSLKDKKTNILEIYPEVKGTVSWKDNIIEFKPEKPLESGKAYFVVLNLEDLSDDITDQTEEFIFRVQTKHQFVNVQIDRVTTTDRQEFTKQDVSGRVKLNDIESLDAIKACLTAKLDDKALSLEIEKIDNLEYYFIIKDVPRTNLDKTLIVTADGSAFGAKNKSSHELQVPSLDKFKVLDVQVNQFPEQFINVIFSDPIKEDQILDGLITLAGVENLNYIIIDNNIKIIPAERMEKDSKLNISTSVVNINEKQLDKKVSKTIRFKMQKPKLELTEKGVIVPTTKEGQVVSFKAVNIKAVDVRILKIYENNVLQFLQDNTLDGSYEFNKVGKVIKTKTISLEQTDVEDFGEENIYYINLKDIIEPEPGAIYRIEIGFRKENAIYPCNNNGKPEDASKTKDNMVIIPEDDSWDWFTDYTYSDGTEESYNEEVYYSDEYTYDDGDYYDDYYYGDYGYGGSSTYEDPCNSNYYGYRRAIKFNVLASDLGLIAKQGQDDKIFAFVTNIQTAEVMINVEVKAYNFQQQVIGSGKTDVDGKTVIVIPKNEKAYFLVASYEKQKSYLKLEEYGSLTTSEFNVSGEYLQDGTKAFIYTERGVWRPGDSIYVGFILNELIDPVPDGHPIVFEVRNPKNQEVYREIQKKNTKSFHVFKFKTELSDPTGYYYAKITIGSKVFSKTLMVETIRPNRLNVDLSLDKEYLAGDGTVNASVKATWLHGADAVDLETQVTMNLTQKYSPFEKFPDYNFYNQMTAFNFTTQTLFTGKTDAAGQCKTLVKFDKLSKAPGVLTATLTTKVFEKSGEFSIGEEDFIYYPYTTFIGITMPDSKTYSYSLPIDKKLTLDMVAVSRDQKLAPEERDLEVSVYMMEYSWWYDYQYDGADFISSNYNNSISREIVKCANGKAKTTVEFDEDGEYLIVVKDKKDGHTASMRVYANRYAGNHNSDSDAANLLKFTASKESYNVGEIVEINIPASTGKALVSIENANTVLSTFWVNSVDKELRIRFSALPGMAPNIYVNVSFIQEHSSTKNDRPIRMYGIIPIMIEDPSTHLNPVISMPNELLAESKIQIKVSEKNGKPMTYTLAMVDEGLLNITNFKTPDPWTHFFSKEALGVRTWDIFDYVIGSFSVDAGKMLSIGGGDKAMSPEDLLQAIRFKPMVKFIGPFTIPAGATKIHEIQLPQYIGSVRTMVIAAEGNSFGSAEKTTAVKKPLMILGSGPRVLGTNESFSLPVTIFAMNPDIKNVSVSVKTNNLLTVNGNSSQSISFTKEGEKYVNFTLKSGAKIGVATIEITATCGAQVSKYNIEMDVRYANTKMTEIVDGISGSQEYKVSFKSFGVEESNESFLELYSIPPMNLESRLDYLTSYPHGCLEQTISAAFPQLYLENLTELTAAQKTDIQKNVNACVSKIQRFQMANGGFSYWPGANDVSEWVTNYAGHFMLEAEKLGYVIPVNVKNNWIKYQKEKSTKWTNDGNASQLTQAYRLYTLSLAGQPDKSAMNRLKETKIQPVSAWRLAGAYALSGKEAIAKEMVSKLTTEVAKYFELSGTFGSDIRDKAIILETLVELGEKDKAFMVLKNISEYIGSDGYASTQTTAYSLLAASKFVKKFGISESIDCTYTLNGKSFTAKTTRPVYKIQLTINEKENNDFSLKSTGGKMLYVRLVNKGVPEAGKETEASSNIKMDIKYTYLNGQTINVTNIPQGTDFVATVIITNTTGFKTLNNVALSQIFPSGWEIINSRLYSVSLGQESYFTYRDIRDDRVLTYLDMYNRSIYTYRIMLNASYEGSYYLPATVCETMYDNSNFARTKGKWVTVSKFQ